MKNLFLALFSFLIVQVCVAQTAPKTKSKSTEEVQFTPPVIKKDADSVQDGAKFTPPVIKKNKTVKKKPAAQFTPPVIVKDNS
jgi:hypothetical protein